MNFENDKNAFKPIKNPVILDFTNCKHIGEIHKIIKKEFNLPEYYGENLDALWDSLDCYCKENLLVQIVGLNTLSKEMMEYMEEILDVFSDVHEENPNITFKIIS